MAKPIKRADRDAAFNSLQREGHTLDHDGVPIATITTTHA